MPRKTRKPRLLTSMQSVVHFGNFEACTLQGQITHLLHPKTSRCDKCSCFRCVICPKLSPASFRRLKTEVLTGSSSAYVGGGDTVEHRGRKQGHGDGALNVSHHRCGSDETAIQACAREAEAQVVKAEADPGVLNARSRVHSKPRRTFGARPPAKLLSIASSAARRGASPG